MELVRGTRETAASPEYVPNGGDPDDRDVFHVSFDPATESVVDVLVNAIAVIHNAEPEELDPLYDTIDTEALDELFAVPAGDDPGVDEVQFVYEGLEVTIDCDGNIWLQWQ